MNRVFLLFIITILITSCTTPGEQISDLSPEPPRSAITPKYGGNIELQIYRSDSLCPLYATAYANSQIFNLIFEGLIERDTDNSINPMLAEAWSVSDNGILWTLNMRNNILWHDETPFTAHDAVYTINTIKSDGIKNIYAHNVNDIKSVKAKDDYTLEITLAKRNFNFVNMLYFPIIKQSSAINKIEFEPVGTGPFIYTAIANTENFLLKKNTQWHGGEIFLDSINVTAAPDNAESSLLAFSYDMIVNTDVSWSMNVSAADLQNAGFQTDTFALLGINHRRPPLDNPEVRRAFSHAIDYRRIIDNILYGQGSESFTPISPSYELFNKSIAYPEFDTETSRKILINDGWELVGDTFEKDGEKLHLELLVNDENPVREQIGTFITTNMHNAGISVLLKKVSYAEYTKLIDKGNYDLFIGEYNISPDLNLEFLLSNSNPFGYKNDELDIYLQNALQALTFSESKQNYNKIQQIFVEDIPFIGLHYKHAVLLYDERLKGTPRPIADNAFRGIESMFIEE